MSEQVNGVWRLVVLDGSELGNGPNGGRVVCADSSGDLPLFMIHIDPTKCSFADMTPGTPVVPIVSVPDVPGIAPPITTAVPEPSQLALLLVGLAMLARRVRWR